MKGLKFDKMFGRSEIQSRESVDMFSDIRSINLSTSLDQICDVLEHSVKDSLYNPDATCAVRSSFIREINNKLNVISKVIEHDNSYSTLCRARLFFDTASLKLTELNAVDLSQDLSHLAYTIEDKKEFAAIDSENIDSKMFEKVGFPYDKEINEILSLEYGEECKQKIATVVLKLHRVDPILYHRVIAKLEPKLSARKRQYFDHATRMSC